MTLPNDEVQAHEPDQLIWRHDKTKGWIRKKIVLSYLITNNHVIAGDHILDLDEISEAVVVNAERVYTGDIAVYGVYSKGLSAKRVRTKGGGTIIGDVIFNSPTKPDIIFHDVGDPDGIVRLIKSLKKSRRTGIEK